MMQIKLKHWGLICTTLYGQQFEENGHIFSHNSIQVIFELQPEHIYGATAIGLSLFCTFQFFYKHELVLPFNIMVSFIIQFRVNQTIRHYFSPLYRIYFFLQPQVERWGYVLKRQKCFEDVDRKFRISLTTEPDKRDMVAAPRSGITVAFGESNERVFIWNRISRL